MRPTMLMLLVVVVVGGCKSNGSETQQRTATEREKSPTPPPSQASLKPWGVERRCKAYFSRGQRATDRATGWVDIVTTFERPPDDYEKSEGRPGSTMVLSIWCTYYAEELSGVAEGDEPLHYANTWGCKVAYQELPNHPFDLGATFRDDDVWKIEGVPHGHKRENSWNVRVGDQEMLINMSQITITLRCPRPLTDYNEAVPNEQSKDCQVIRTNANVPNEPPQVGGCTGQVAIPRMFQQPLETK